MSYLFWTVLHIIGVFGFQHTGILWFLAPGALHILVSMFIFVFGVAAALTPNFEVEKLDDKLHQNFGYRFLMQVGVIVTAVQLFMVGYEFFAGMAILQGVVLAMAVTLQKLFDKE